MKIDKRNPTHWLCLALFGLNTLVAMALRPLLHRRRTPRQVILYGHKLSGNLLALHRHVSANAGDEFRLTFLTMDKRYARQLRADGMRAAIATRPEAIMLLARADALVSDHGLHVMSWLPGHCSIWFFDVWHGFGFKGHVPDDFALLRRYHEVWVASPLQAAFYRNRFQFAPDRVKVTGYARTDALVTKRSDVAAARHHLGLNAPTTGRIVLFAPTWKQDDASRSIWPFGESMDAFLRVMSATAVRSGSTLIVRSHLNTETVTHPDHPRVVWVPLDAYPDTEALLLACDILVCDWSSIAFDWLLLDRPAFFLDVPAPFTHGHTLGPQYRYGEIVSSLNALADGLEHALANADDYWHCHGDVHARIKTEVYGAYADGCAARRCMDRLQAALDVAQPRT